MSGIPYLNPCGVPTNPNEECCCNKKQHGCFILLECGDYILQECNQKILTENAPQ